MIPSPNKAEVRDTDGRTRERNPSGESGYAYVMSLFLVLTIIIGSQVVLQNLVTLGRRQREEETIWRGQQYIRAIRSYYRKVGHYPQTVDDLEMGLPQLHFLRSAAYKNPMNPSDHTWRFIYINAAGGIIGSVKFSSLQQMALLDMNGGLAPPVQQTGAFGMPASGMSSSPSGASGNATQNSANQPAGTGTVALAGQLQPTGPVDGPVLGAFLTGVGIPPNVDWPSIRVYKGAKKYSDWEFIWNPLEDQARAVQNGLSPQAPPSGIGLPIGPAGTTIEPNGGGPTTGPITNSGGAVIPPPSSPPNQPPSP